MTTKIVALLARLATALLCLPAQAGTVTYFHNDLAGTPLAATDANGNLLWRQGYKPYGERLDPKAPAEQQPWFTGKAHVEAAGLSYYGARWYDPQLGRFMGVDPKGFDEANVHSFNQYAYANNNPYRFVDPDGRQAMWVTPPPGLAASAPPTLSGKPSEAQQIRNLEGFGSSSSLPSMALPSFGASDVVNFLLGGIPAVLQERSSNLIFNDGGDKVQGSRVPGAETRRKADSAATDDRGVLRCQYCGVELTDRPGSPNSREYDHITPWSRGGDSSAGNIADSCRTCNRQKGPRTPEEWGGPK